MNPFFFKLFIAIYLYYKLIVDFGFVSSSVAGPIKLLTPFDSSKATFRISVETKINATFLPLRTNQFGTGQDVKPCHFDTSSVCLMINLAKRRGDFLTCDNRKSLVNDVKVETTGHFFQTVGQ